MITLNNIPHYEYIKDLCIITSYFNPWRYTSKLRNFQIFKKSLEQSKLHYIVVEASFGNMNFELEKSPHIIQIKGKDIMWQKERMLNLALSKISSSCEKVAWLDCDIFFKKKVREGL